MRRCWNRNAWLVGKSGEHDDKAHRAAERQSKFLRQRRGEPGHRAVVAIHAPHGPGRRARVDRLPWDRSYSNVMRPLRYSINVTLDGCCDHRAGSPDDELHRYWAEKLAQADALLFGRVTYEMMEAAWRLPATGVRPDWMADWMEPFARTIDAAKKYVVSSTLDRVDWNAELVRGDLGKAVQQLKRESGKGLF